MQDSRFTRDQEGYIVINTNEAFEEILALAKDNRFEKVSFSNINFSAYNDGNYVQYIFTECKFHSCNLQSCNLSSVCFESTEIRQCDFSGANLSQAILTETCIFSTKLNNVNLTNAKLRSIYLAALLGFFRKIMTNPGFYFYRSYRDFFRSYKDDSYRKTRYQSDLIESGQESDLTGADLTNAELVNVALTRKLAGCNFTGVKAFNAEEALAAGAELNGTTVDIISAKRKGLVVISTIFGWVAAIGIGIASTPAIGGISATLLVGVMGITALYAGRYFMKNYAKKPITLTIEHGLPDISPCFFPYFAPATDFDAVDRLDNNPGKYDPPRPAISTSIFNCVFGE